MYKCHLHAGGGVREGEDQFQRGCAMQWPPTAAFGWELGLFRAPVGS